MSTEPRDPHAVLYRPANFEDCRPLAEMRWRLDAGGGRLPEDRALFMDRCATWIRNAIALGTWTVWVAEVDRGLVGHAFVQLVEKAPQPGRPIDRYGYVSDLAVLPEHDEAIGERLLEWVKMWALGAGLELLLAWPTAGTRPLYERAGFTPERQALVFPLREGLA